VGNLTDSRESVYVARTAVGFSPPRAAGCVSPEDGGGVFAASVGCGSSEDGGGGSPPCSGVPLAPCMAHREHSQGAGVVGEVGSG